MMTKELSDRCWDTIKEMTSSYQTKLEQESEEEKEEESAMAALMRSGDEEQRQNCKLVRDVIESQRGQKEKQF